MKRKAKITLILSSITLILASAAQFYTNHKIDRSLQSFPYHLKDQLTLHVTEKSRSFFQRELVFTLEDAQQQKKRYYFHSVDRTSFYDYCRIPTPRSVDS
ncbi:putative transmembrane protein [Pasteurella multocida]|nr:putative transmembrane protein [Pasteurella multocida]